jgi:CBS domain-containing protein
MKVKDCMTKDVVTVRRSTTLKELIGLFKKHNFHTIPVIEEDRSLAGIVNFEDMLKTFQPYGANVARILNTIPLLLLDDDVEEDLVLSEISGEMGVLVLTDDLMNRQFATVSEEMEIKDVRALMRVNKVNVVPVLKDNKLVGVISLFDIIYMVFKEKGLI